MADIDEAVPVGYGQEVIRPAAASLLATLKQLDRIQADRKPDALDLDALFAGEGQVVDGAPANGRLVVTTGHVRAFLRLCEVVVSMADDDRDPTTGEHTGLTSRSLLHRLAHPNVS